MDGLLQRVSNGQGPLGRVNPTTAQRAEHFEDEGTGHIYTNLGRSASIMLYFISNWYK